MTTPDDTSRESAQRHEIEDLMEDFQTVCEEEADRTPKDHLPPAVQVMINGAIRSMPPSITVNEMALTFFKLGLRQGSKGKTFEDYTKCVC